MKITGSPIRQGDVLLYTIASLPKNLKPYPRKNGRIILAEGEATGHCHVIEEETTKSFVDAEGNLYLEIVAPAPVKHEEHSVGIAEPGFYVIPKQREFSDDLIQAVKD